jgi:hypothetical protein
MRRNLSPHGRAAAVAALAVLGLTAAPPVAWTHDAKAAVPHAPAASAPAAGSATVSFRDPQEQKFIDAPQIHAFYRLAVAAFANGPDKVDVDAFEKQSFVLFREMATSWGANPDALQDHLKLIPRQVVSIAREDPKALASYENFTAALLGPA